MMKALEYKDYGWWNKYRWLVLVLLLVFGLTLTPLIYMTSRTPTEVSASWWNDHFQYRQRLPISNGSGETKTDFQLKLELDTQALIAEDKISDNCADMSFTDRTGKQLHYWLEPNTCDTDSTIVFIKIPTIPTTGTDIYWYYGSPTTTTSPRTSTDIASNVFNQVIDGAIANWPLDDPPAGGDPTQSYARVINQGKDLGRDIVINGGFDDALSWTTFDGVTIDQGTANFDGTQVTSSSTLRQTNIWLIPGKLYQLEYTISDYVSGSIYIKFNNVFGTPRSGNGTYSQVLTNDSNWFAFLSEDSFIGKVDSVIIRQVDITSSASIDSTTELLVDGDMEAVDTTNWPSSLGLSTKETADPQAGARNLRISRTATNNPSVSQASVTSTGKSYRLLGYARSDGFTSPRIISGSPVIWTGTTSTSWQPFNFVFASTSTSLSLQSNNADSGTRYSEFDSMSIVEIPPMVGRNTNGVTVGAVANGHLDYAYSFDGTNDVVNIYSSDLNSVFNPDEGTVSLWIKVADASIWTDGQARYPIFLAVDGSNRVYMYKNTTSNGFVYGYIAGGVTKGINISTSTTDWMHVVLSWNKSSDQVKAFLNGVQAGTTQTSLGTWSGNLSSTQTFIGAVNSSGASPWSGLINDVRLYDRALSPTEIAAMYSPTTDIQVYATDNLPGKELIRQFDSSITLGTPATVEIAPGPIAHWSFDSLEGSTVRDVSGNGNNGTNNGATLLTEDQCISGKCMRFDGDPQHVSNSIVSTPKNITVGAWIKTNSTTRQTIAARLESSGQPNRSFLLNINETGNPNKATFGILVNSTIHFVNTTSDINDGKWHYVVGTYDGERADIYVDGKYEAGNTTMSGDMDISFGFEVGARIGHGSPDYFQGTIDEVKIYPYARSAEEIKMDYLAGAASAGSGAVLGVGDQSFLSNGLVGYWKMDEASWNGTAGEVIDASGNGNHGTAENGLTTTYGKFGSAGSFNTIDNRYIATSISQQPSAKSVFLWIKRSGVSGVTEYLAQSTGEAPYFAIYFSNRLIVYERNSTGFGGSCYGSVESAITDTQWHHVGYTIEKAGNQLVRKIYVDGLDVTSSPCTQIIGDYANDSIGNYIGGKPGLDSFNGLIDEARIYNRALSPAEVRALYEWAPGPVGHWKFDEGEGTTAYDSSGNGNNGNLVNNPTWTNGVYGTALGFNGSNQRVVLSDTNYSIGTGDLTVNLWFKMNQTPTAYTYLIDQAYCGSNNRGFQVWASSGHIALSVKNGSTNFGSNTTSVTPYVDGKWHNLQAVVRRNQERPIDLYIDGVKFQSLVGDINGWNLDQSTMFFGSGTCVGASHFNGLIDDVKIYNYARTPEQIKEDMMAGRPLDHESVEDPTPTKKTIQLATGDKRNDIIDGPGADPIAYWDFNERTGTTLTDKSGNGNDGTLVNGPEWVAGKYGAGLEFDSSKQTYANLGNSPLYDLANTDHSFSLWFYRKSRSTSSQVFFRRLVGGSPGAGYIMSSISTGNISFSFRTTEGTFELQTSEYEINKWSHILVTVDSSSKRVNFYSNGRLVSTGTYTGEAINHNTDLTLSGRASNGWFDGLIDEVRIFDYTLTPAQVAYEYNRGAPIAHWMMDECEGSTIHDASGNENHGNLIIGLSGSQTTIGTCDTPGTAWGNGKAGRLNSGMSFDGVDDYVWLDSNGNGILDTNGGDDLPELEGISQFTVATWFNTSSVSGIGSIVSKYIDSGSERGWMMRREGTSIVFSNFTESSANSAIVGNITTNQWYHAVGVYNGAQIKLYINGVEQASNGLTGINRNTNAPLVIGARDAISQLFTGKIDDVRLYNYALSANQVKTLYNNGAVSFR